MIANIEADVGVGVEAGVVGLGYAGLCMAPCLAKKFKVTGVDVDKSRVARLNQREARGLAIGAPA